jgi:hypothetical protein
MRRLVSVAVSLVLASCAAAVTTNPTPGTPIDQSPAPDVAPSSPSPTTPVVAAPSETPRAPLLLSDRLGSVRADFDCDGSPDLLEFFNAPRQGSYVGHEAGKLARLTRSWGAVVDLAFDGMPGDDPVRNPLIGVADVNGDGCDDAIIDVGHGASTTWTTFLVFDGTDLRRVEEDGKPVTFLFGGSVRHGNAIECRRTKDAAEIVARAVSDYTSDFQWEAVEDVHHWSSKSQLVLWSTTQSVIAVSIRYAMPADQERYWGFSCGSVKLSG